MKEKEPTQTKRSFFHLHATECIFFIFSLLIGGMFALSVPAGAGLDEPSHIARVYQLAEGKILPTPLAISEVDANYSTVADTGYELYGDYVDAALIETSVTNMRTFHLRNDKFAFPVYSDDKIISSLHTGSAEIAFAFPNSIINNPLAYAPSVITFAIAKLFTTNAYALILAMRFGMLLFYALGIFFAIRIAPFGKRIIAFIFLIPGVIDTSVVVTADTATSVAIALFVASVCRMLVESKPTKGHYAAWIVSSLLMTACKTPYLPFVFLSFLYPLTSRLRKPAKTAQEDKQHKVFTITSIALPFATCICAYGWLQFTLDINTAIMFKADVFPEQQQAFVKAHLLHFLRLAFETTLSSNVLLSGVCDVMTKRPGYVVSPNYFENIFLVVVIIVEIIAATKLLSRRNFRISKLHACVGVCGSVVVLASSTIFMLLAIYLKFTAVESPIIEAVQERYWAPLLFLGCMLGCFFVSVVAARLVQARLLQTRRTDSNSKQQVSKRMPQSSLTQTKAFKLLFSPTTATVIFVIAIVSMNVFSVQIVQSIFV